jgi:predicted PurR-regulated permease PerM
VASLAPLVSEQARDFTANLPSYYNSVQANLDQINNRYIRYKIPEAIQKQMTDKATEIGGDISTRVQDFLIALVSYLPWLIIIPILAFFFLKDANFFRI